MTVDPTIAFIAGALFGVIIFAGGVSFANERNEKRKEKNAEDTYEDEAL